jgi:uncharacterized protein YyaL (SSP411 family)
MNRLSSEKSPYLLQHAGNPVDWYPWGAEAFAAARGSDKPIFLSVGYSTCHWCHVMEHESFENDEVARVLNEHFVSIKLDREERPDVDRVYMTFVQASTGGGGWPMSVWLTPDLQPFFGGTYFPPVSRWGRPGFVDLLRQIAELWREDRGRIVRGAAEIGRQVAQASVLAAGDAVPGERALERAADEFRQVFDDRFGGFGGAPKFPRPSELFFLLREFRRSGDAALRDMVVRTLHAMAAGGMRDHVGGGFHRYSVDAEWRVPHFEKMLYDQAQLVLAYLEAAQAAGESALVEVAEDTLRYVQRDMTDAGGGFYSAEDADSIPPGAAGAHETEGAFYVWDVAEIDGILGAAAEVVKPRSGSRPGGNAPHDPQGEFAGKNILYAAASVAKVAHAAGQSTDAVGAAMGRARQRLFDAREKRPRPRLDDKILTAWNGLMIAAFARAARVVPALATAGDRDAAMNAKSYLASARRAASFVRERLWDEGRERLRRRYRDGETAIEGYAEDYACLVFGLIELFQADGDAGWLEWAVRLQAQQDTLFWDDAQGGWFGTTGEDPSVPLRLKEDYDGAEPSASSVAVLNLLRLGHLTGDAAMAARAGRTFRLFSSRMATMARAVPMMLAALATWHAGVQQVVVAAERPDIGAEALLRVVNRSYLPFAVVVPSLSAGTALGRIAPAMAAMRPSGGQATAYVCRDFACQSPTTDPDTLAGLLARA